MISEEIKDMTNEDLATALRDSGVNVGPITGTTRLVYERKLARLQQDLPPVTASTESEEDEEEENLPDTIYEEKASERPHDFPAKVTRSVTRESRRRASPPPDAVDPNTPQASRNRKATQKRGGKSKKTSTLENKLSESVPEKADFTLHSVQNFNDETKLDKEPKSLPKPKPKSNIPRSSQANYANSTVAYPELKANNQRRSFGLSDSFHISPVRSSDETKTKRVYSEEEHVDDQNYVTGCDQKQDSNEIISNEFVHNQQETYFDNQFADNLLEPEYDNHPTNNYVPVTNPSMTNMEYSRQGQYFSQETNSSGLLYDTEKPVKVSEKFGSYIPRWSHGSPPNDQRTKRSNMFASGHFGQSKSSDIVPGSEKSDSIWKIDPVEKENIERGLSEVGAGSADSLSVKYEYLPKAFREKYGRYMNVSGSKGGSDDKKDCQSIDSLLFQSYREQAKSSSSDSVAQHKAKKLTGPYQRFTSPLTSKISGGNRSAASSQSYIGTPGNSQLNTSLTRRPLRDEVTFTSLRSSQATSASAVSNPKKKGISIMVKIIILIVLGLIIWLIYINFESAATKPLLTTNH